MRAEWREVEQSGRMESQKGDSDGKEMLTDVVMWKEGATVGSNKT